MLWGNRTPKAKHIRRGMGWVGGRSSLTQSVKHTNKQSMPTVKLWGWRRKRIEKVVDK